VLCLTFGSLVACTDSDPPPTPPPPSSPSSPAVAVDPATTLESQDDYLERVRAAEPAWRSLSEDDRAARQAELKRQLLGGE
jgi:hypothetical protein